MCAILFFGVPIIVKWECFHYDPLLKKSTFNKYISWARSFLNDRGNNPGSGDRRIGMKVILKYVAIILKPSYLAPYTRVLDTTASKRDVYSGSRLSALSMKLIWEEAPGLCAHGHISFMDSAALRT